MSTFLSSPYYQEVRTLICNERVRLANCYLRFNGLDGRFLLTGAANCAWSSYFEQFVPKESWFDKFLTDSGVLKTHSVNSNNELLEKVQLMKPMRELVTLQQGDEIGGARVLTEVCLFKPANGPVLLSELRQGKEGFDFELDEAELARRFSFAELKEIQVLDGDAFRSVINGLDAYRIDFIELHNRSVCVDSLTTKNALSGLINENSEKVEEFVGQLNQLPTFFALKYCGPVCWYFNRIVQSVLGLQAQFSSFEKGQIDMVMQIDRQSQICRNLGLMVGRKAMDKVTMARLKTNLEKLISNAMHLDQLIIK